MFIALKATGGRVWSRMRTAGLLRTPLHWQLFPGQTQGIKPRGRAIRPVNSGKFAERANRPRMSPSVGLSSQASIGVFFQTETAALPTQPERIYSSPRVQAGACIAVSVPVSELAQDREPEASHHGYPQRGSMSIRVGCPFCQWSQPLRGGRSGKHT